MKKVIEITGPAGVGKSFLCHKLCSNLDAIQQKRPSIFSLPLIKSFSIIPFLFLLKRGRFHIYINFLINAAKWKIIKKSKQGIYIIDEGPWHLLCGSLLPRVSSQRKKTFLKNWKFFMDLPDIIVYLKAEPKFIQTRRMARNRKKEKTLDLKEIEDAIYDFELSLNITKDEYRDIEFITFKLEEDTSIDILSDSMRKIFDNNIDRINLQNEINLHI